MLAEEQCGCIIHFIDVELMMNMESVVSRESRIVRRIQHEVTIALPFYIISRMKGGLSLIAVKNAYVARQACVQRESELVCGNAALCVEMGDLRKRMYAAVSPARSMQCAPFACKLGELACCSAPC